MNGFEGGAYNVLVTEFSPDGGKLSEYLNKKENVVIYDEKKDTSRRSSGSFLPSLSNDTSFTLTLYHKKMNLLTLIIIISLYYIFFECETCAVPQFIPQLYLILAWYLPYT